MNTKYAVSITITNLLILAFVLFWHFNQGVKQQVVFVNSAKVFNGFTMTKELKSTGEKWLGNQNRQLDSIYKILNDPTAKSNKQELVKEAVLLKKGMEDYQQDFATANSEKIWTRINAYAGEFAKANKHQIIIGSQNNDNVLYGDEQSDVTNNLLAYINKKYAGY